MRPAREHDGAAAEHLHFSRAMRLVLLVCSRERYRSVLHVFARRVRLDTEQQRSSSAKTEMYDIRAAALHFLVVGACVQGRMYVRWIDRRCLAWAQDHSYPLCQCS